MTYTQHYKVSNTRLVITLPDAFKDKQVIVTVDDKMSAKEDKMALMKQAAKDPLYLSDLNEVNDDFSGIEQYDKQLDAYVGKIRPSAKLKEINKLLANTDIKALLAE